jgi:hypothetical protein
MCQQSHGGAHLICCVGLTNLFMDHVDTAMKICNAWRLVFPVLCRKPLPSGPQSCVWEEGCAMAMYGHYCTDRTY